MTEKHAVATAEGPRPVDLRLSSGLVVCLAVGAIMLSQTQSRAFRALQRVQQESEEIEVLAGQIRGSKNMAGSSQIPGQLNFTSEKIAVAKLAAGISDQQNTLISPQPVRQLPDSSFEIQSTVMEFGGVSMEQVIRLLVSLEQGENSLRVERISFKALNASNQDDQELWNVGLTLTAIAISSKSVGGKAGLIDRRRWAGPSIFLQLITVLVSFL